MFAIVTLNSHFKKYHEKEGNVICYHQLCWTVQEFICHDKEIDDVELEALLEIIPIDGVMNYRVLLQYPRVLKQVMKKYKISWSRLSPSFYFNGIFTQSTFILKRFRNMMISSLLIEGNNVTESMLEYAARDGLYERYKQEICDIAEEYLPKEIVSRYRN